MTHLLGVPHVDRFTVVDAEGTLLTGVTFTADQTIDPGGASFDVEVSEVGTGLYQVTWPQPVAGLYYTRLVSDTVPFQVFEFTSQTDDWEVGDTVTHYFTLRGVDGNYYGGTTFAIQHAIDPGGGAFAPLVVDLLNGLYRVSWFGAAAGVWTTRLVTTNLTAPNEPQLFEFESRVVEVETIESPLIGLIGTTLDELVRDVALACRDFLDVRATADSGNSETFTDTISLAARSPKSVRGADLFISEAASDLNVGRQARVAQSDDAAMTLSPPLPAPVRAGDEGYLVNLEGKGFTRQTYVNQINASISKVFPIFVVPAMWSFPDPFDSASPFLVPPIEFTHIYAVSVPGEYDPVYVPAGDANAHGWYWDYGAGHLVLTGHYREGLHDAVVTIRGFGRAPQLTGPADQTPVNRWWLVEQTAGTMIVGADPRRMAEGQSKLNNAASLLVTALTTLPPGTIRIR